MSLAIAKLQMMIIYEKDEGVKNVLKDELLFLKFRAGSGKDYSDLKVEDALNEYKIDADKFLSLTHIISFSHPKLQLLRSLCLIGGKYNETQK